MQPALASKPRQPVPPPLLRAQANQQAALKACVLVFTVKRAATDRGFKGALHVCKHTDGKLEVGGKHGPSQGQQAQHASTAARPAV
jgi:hypothetical protein